MGRKPQGLLQHTEGDTDEMQRNGAVCMSACRCLLNAAMPFAK